MPLAVLRSPLPISCSWILVFWNVDRDAREGWNSTTRRACSLAQNLLEQSPLSQGASRRGGVWKHEAGPEMREADSGIEPMLRIGSMRAARVVHVAQVEQVGDADQGAAQGHHRRVQRQRAVVPGPIQQAGPEQRQPAQQHAQRADVAVAAVAVDQAEDPDARGEQDERQFEAVAQPRGDAQRRNGGQHQRQQGAVRGAHERAGGAEAVDEGVEAEIHGRRTVTCGRGSVQKRYVITFSGSRHPLFLEMHRMSQPVPAVLSVALAVALAPAAFAALPPATPVAVAAGAAQDGTPGQSTATDPHVTDLDSVVVNANPLPDDAESLIRPVEVLTGARLDEARSSSLGQTVGKLPGVQSSYFGPGVGRPIVRGFDGARVQVLSNGLGSGDVSTVSVDHAVSIEPFLADQIEVLKGPSTLLYGSGAIGGAVNVVDGRVPQAATDQPLQGRAELRADSVNDGKTGMARLDGTSASGHLVFHFDALH